MVPLRLFWSNRLQQTETHRERLPQKHHPKRWQEAKFTHSMVKDVSIPLSVGMVPLSLFWSNALQQTEAHRVNYHINPPKEDKKQIHSQRGQRCEDPNLSGNGSAQVVLMQIPAANISPQSKIAAEALPEKDDKRQNSLTVCSKMWASQSQWERFRSGRSYADPCSKHKPTE